MKTPSNTSCVLMVIALALLVFYAPFLSKNGTPTPDNDRTIINRADLLPAATNHRHALSLRREEPATSPSHVVTSSSRENSNAQLPAANRGIREYMERVITTVRFEYLFRNLETFEPDIRTQILSLLYARDRLQLELRAQGAYPESKDDALALEAEIRNTDYTIAALCGNQGVKVLDLLKLSGPMELVRNSIAVDMRYSDVPLQPEQEIQLAKLMYSLHVDPNSHVWKMLRGDSALLKATNVQLYVAAQSLLSPEQLNVLAAYQEELEVMSLDKMASRER